MGIFLSLLKTSYSGFRLFVDPAIEGTPYERAFRNRRGKSGDDKPHTPIFRKRFLLR